MPAPFNSSPRQSSSSTATATQPQVSRMPSCGKVVGGPFVYFVPDLKVLGGSVAVGAILPVGHSCGSLFIGQADQCASSVGDPYVEVDWARFFGRVRASSDSGAYPILEGLSVLVGFGVVIPVGSFDSRSPLAQALSLGTNIWDFAPTVALTYTTRPILADGTELSAKFYWNTYLNNSTTDYSTGDLLDIDFALTEHIGRFQVGIGRLQCVADRGRQNWRCSHPARRTPRRRTSARRRRRLRHARTRRIGEDQGARRRAGVEYADLLGRGLQLA